MMSWCLTSQTLMDSQVVREWVAVQQNWYPKVKTGFEILDERRKQDLMKIPMH